MPVVQKKTTTTFIFPFSGGGLGSQNPARTIAHSPPGVKETFNYWLREKIWEQKSKKKIRDQKQDCYSRVLPWSGCSPGQGSITSPGCWSGCLGNDFCYPTRSRAAYPPPRLGVNLFIFCCWRCGSLNWASWRPDRASWRPDWASWRLD